MKISVLYGTETGNAEMLAEDIQSALQAEHDVACRDLAETDPADLDGEAFLVVVCSTYGEGDLPGSAQPFADRIDAARPDLSPVRFAIFGLGDAEYGDTFANGSKRLAEKLRARGATQVGERMIHDASGDDMAEDVALPWVSSILEEISNEAAI